MVMPKQRPLVTIFGRANVGKSTLFNRIVGRKIALVYDEPGLTRDSRSAYVQFGRLKFDLSDTPGLIDFGDHNIPTDIIEGMKNQALATLENSDIVLFIIDAKQGITPNDEELAQTLRRKSKTVITVINKSEAKDTEWVYYEAQKFGFHEAISISAEHGIGLSDLEETLYTCLESINEAYVAETVESKDENLKPIKVSIAGRPNVGKSTLLNALLKEEVQLVADHPGVTRDSITYTWEYKGQEFELTDTAGIRRRSRTGDSLESLAVMDTLNSIKYAEIVILVIDASVGIDNLIEKQDLQIASQIISEGRALVLALNKWDQVNNPQETLKHVYEQLDIHLSQGKGLPCITLSAKLDLDFSTLMENIIDTYALWNTRISTSKLNDWLHYTIENHSPPIVSGRRIKLKYITQIKSRPPTFHIYCTKADEMPESYVKYLMNKLRKDFQLAGVPLRLNFKSQRNPFSKTKK